MLTKLSAASVVGLIALTACAQSSSETLSQVTERRGASFVRSVPEHTAFVHLFEWTWRDIALECENVLGPAGVNAVQISPPQEHRLMPGEPWYQRYQPVSYKLESRSGTRAEFIDMVERCHAVGVDVISDAVVNHMAQTLPAGRIEYGSAGTPYGRYNHPGLFSYIDFHHCGRYSDSVIRNYQDRWEVQNCELLGLADLNTGAESVRSKIADFLNEQVSLGVNGFRIDAAKHISSADVSGIVSKLDKSVYIFQEVIDQGGEPIASSEYLDNGSVTEFRVGLALASLFRRGDLSVLGSMGAAWGLLPSDSAVVFTDNHDNQRGHGGGGWVLTYKDGILHSLANSFLLAFPYGTVGLMSSFDFRKDSDGPPSYSDGTTKPVYLENGESNCKPGLWICEHRDPMLLAMFGFRNEVVDQPLNNWWSSSGGAQIAFSRGDKGWFALNIESKALDVRISTSIPDGTYCNLFSGRKSSSDGCQGQTIEVRDGVIRTQLPALGALAITESSRLDR
ncbi:MAG: hypothetical protein RJB13_2383 [Pseudomonadota bacterium]